MLASPGSLLELQNLRTCTKPAESEWAFDHSAPVIFMCIKVGDVLDISVYVDTKL